MNAPVRVPVLTWHSMNVAGPDYARNEHVAFREDLETIHRMGLRVVPVMEIARALVEGRLAQLRGCVGLTFDDGSDFDFHDLPHPAQGPQRAMAGILRDFRARHGAGAQPRLHATSFAIVSPAAREELDRTCMIGCGWWNDGWWPQAEAEGLLAVESHGWDHNHDSLARTVASSPRGAFDLRTKHDADAQIAQASIALRRLRGREGEVLFAYPYGVPNDYLAGDYLPNHMADHGVYAAFSTDPAPVNASSSRWSIPRYVSGSHWKSPAQLERLLGAAGCLPASPRAVADEPDAATQPGWRDCLRTWEVNDARVLAGDLFKRCFGHGIPDYPRHFVLVYSPPAGTGELAVVAYVHQTPYGDVHLGGGMCVDERAYRRMPRPLFAQVREQGGLATIVTRDSVAMLGDSLASFGHVGESRARAADLRTGYVDTGLPHLMVMWRKPLDDAQKARIIDRVDAHGPF